MKKLIYTLILLFLMSTGTFANQKKFFNLTASQVRVDSVIPEFVWSMPLHGDYADSVYSASIVYPEFIDASQSDVDAYYRLGGTKPAAMPTLSQQISESREERSLVFSFCPVVFRNGRYQLLVSFMLDVKSSELKRSVRRANVSRKAAASKTYASHSVLASGNWAKIRVPASGVYQLTSSLIKKAGFTDISKVKVYGYGGNLQNETLLGSDLAEYDDLKQVPVLEVDGKRLFYARGPVSWSNNTAARRTRNPYSDYGYYFITQSDEVPSVYADSATFVSSFYPSADDYHSLYEVDGYSWYHGGRNLFDKESVSAGNSKRVVLHNSSASTFGRLSVNVSAGTASNVQVLLNDSVLGSLNIYLGSYDKGNDADDTYLIRNIQPDETDTVTIKCISGGPVRLDYVSMAWQNPESAPQLRSVTSVPEYVCNITNQDHHADSEVDMVIIIPTSQRLLAQAQRLKTFHEIHDSLSVTIVPADELYNEFSSGTPDVNAYRRYMKMLYDRASTTAQKPKYLLLFGDCVWDNRMLTADCKSLSLDDYLLCYESENSFNEITCYVDDSWIGLLDEGEGGSPATQSIDIAVGRFPVTSAAEAKIMVDKTISYATNENSGSWENTLVYMGDDGNNDLHMRDEDQVADYISTLYPAYLTKKIMWDAYNRVSTSTGNTYPEVSSLIKKYQNEGALIMDYAGHGSEIQISHEAVVKLSDFESFSNKNLPLWITASCDIMPFDGITATIGEAAVLNPNGGAVAFYGTTRTVYANLNKYMNRAFLRHVLSRDAKGKAVTLGEAHRLAQNELMTGSGYNRESDRTTNHLQYSLLGDPALALNLPKYTIIVDSINGTALASSDSIMLKAGSIARIAGHIEGASDFKGVVTATVRDTEQLITCKANDFGETDSSNPFTYYDRPVTLYSGSDSISGGHFNLRFAVSKDIIYANGSGLMNLFASSTDHAYLASGATDNFLVGGSSIAGTDSIGPSIYAWLNSSSFIDGGNVNTTPYFVAQLSDKDGINASGSGIGHNMQLIIDGQQSMTYDLNDNFSFDFGSYTSGSTYYSIPRLPVGPHKLIFRAWDVLNNSSTTSLTFNVVEGLEPSLFDVSLTANPASTSTTFIISHDRTGSAMNVRIDVFDASGRALWSHQEKGVNTGGAYTVTWNLNSNAGMPVHTGVYLYRVGISSDGSDYVEKTKKLIIFRQ